MQLKALHTVKQQYFREQEAQLPQRNSASAAHVKGRGTYSQLSLLWLHLRVWLNAKATTYVYVNRAVHKAHFKMNEAFKVIQGHPYWCRQESRMVCCRNVQLMPTSFLKLTKIRQRENCKFVDFNDHTQVWRRPSMKRLRRSANDVYYQKPELLTYIFAADSMGLYSLVFT